MVNAEVIINAEVRSINYPCLVQENDGDRILLLSEDSVGVIISSKSDSTDIGDYEYCWEMDDFHLFDGEVRLSNE